VSVKGRVLSALSLVESPARGCTVVYAVSTRLPAMWEAITRSSKVTGAFPGQRGCKVYSGMIGPSPSGEASAGSLPGMGRVPAKRNVLLVRIAWTVG
jgi:hypothetical protein